MFCDRVVVEAFPLPTPPSTGQAPLQRPPFLVILAAGEVRLGLWELCNAAALLPESQLGSSPAALTATERQAGERERPLRPEGAGLKLIVVP